ncbi:MAG: DUF4040 domain-containing protein, partial [Dehalococcoidia bacterium]|nr:DUF4040 domain-containing protein [Dehalococcoidia bacterium]
EHEDEGSREGALQALLVTNAGGVAMLAGLVLLGQVAGAQELSSLAGAADTVRDDGLYLPILLLILAGAFTKSAQFPFHFWLPGAMAAPTPVSAFLHSATMVKAGVYLLARLAPTLGGTDEWSVLLTTVGAVTMVLGGVIAFYQTDLKRILAYSTVSSLGVLVLLLGLDTPEASTGALVLLLAHALYKAALFMAAGAVDHETGTRDVLRLRGLRTVMPLTAAVAALAGFSLAGFGPLLSFIGKELMFEAELHAESLATLLAAAGVVGGALFVLVAGLVSVRPFVGERAPTPRDPHEASPALLLGPALLGVLGVVFGVAPGLVESKLLQPAVAAVTAGVEGPELELWHGFVPALGLSALSVVLGIGLYLRWAELREGTRWAHAIMAWGPERFYGLGIAALRQVAYAHTRVMQNGYLRIYLFVTFFVSFGLAGYTLLTRVGLESGGGVADVHFYHVALAALMLLAAFGAAVVPSRLVAIALLGVVGYGVALTYILFGAPDLAMTQFMIETLTVLLFLAAFSHLPTARNISSFFARGRDALLALGAGAFMTALTLVASAHRGSSPSARFFAEESVPGGHGRNIVNVILVDFRALDTLGEITVLAIAAFGVFALLRLRPASETEEDSAEAEPPPLIALARRRRSVRREVALEDEK